MIRLKKCLSTVFICSALLFSACRQPYVPAVVHDQNNLIQQAGMQLTKIDGLSGDADSYLFDETKDDDFTGKAAICYNLTKDSIVYAVHSDYAFKTDRFSSFSILKSVLEYETEEDYLEMMQEPYMQDLRVSDLFRTVKELANYKEFFSLYKDTTYVPINNRLDTVAQYDCWDETNRCMRFLYLEKDNAQEYILLLIGVDTDDGLNQQTDHIVSYLIK